MNRRNFMKKVGGALAGVVAVALPKAKATKSSDVIVANGKDAKEVLVHWFFENKTLPSDSFDKRLESAVNSAKCFMGGVV